MTDKMTDIKPFELKDIIVGSTVMSGFAGILGRKVAGRVRRILPGICFEVEIGGGTALLWRKYEIITEEKEHGRPDHPDEYKGMRAVVDCDFWVEQGVEPLFLASESDCFPDVLPPSPNDRREQLENTRALAVVRGTNSQAAWTRQMASVSAMTVSGDRSVPLRTPPRPPRSDPVCPPAPTKDRNLGGKIGNDSGNGSGNDSDNGSDNDSDNGSDNDSGNGSGNDSGNDSGSGSGCTAECECECECGDDEYGAYCDCTNGNECACECHTEESGDDNEDDESATDTYIPRHVQINLYDCTQHLEDFLNTETTLVIANKQIVAFLIVILSILVVMILSQGLAR
jgi:hypothetical protein